MDTAIVYGIFQIDTNECVYVGSTSRAFRERIASHKYSTSRSNYKIYQIINDRGGWEAFRFEIIVEVISSQQFEWERLVYNHYKPIGNNYRMNVTDDEYSQWTEEYNKTYYEKNLEKIRNRDKEYYHNNMESCNKRNRQWQTDNAEYLKEYRSQKTTCTICESIILRQHIARHQRSQKCLNFNNKK